MKKRLFSLLLIAAMAVSTLAACGGGANSGTEAGTNTEGEGAGTTEVGSVYYLNFKPEQDAAWQALAKA